MASGKIRLKRSTAKDLLTLAGILTVATMIMYALPEIDSDLPPSDAVILVAALGVIYFIARRVKTMFRKRTPRRHRP
jgi:hypothetical protein